MVKIKESLFVFVVTTVCFGNTDGPDKIFMSVYYESNCPDSKSFVLNQLVPAVSLLKDSLSLRLVPFGKSRIFMSVYYESNCPDSKSFVLNQLVPAVSLLKDSLSLRLVPFGKSRSINHGNDGFECQHGPQECFGNLVHDCALDLMQDRSLEERVAYVACEMETEAGSKGDLTCVQKSDLSVHDLHQCVTFGRGVELQLESEYLTKLVMPKFVPTVTFDGIFNQQIQDMAQVDLIATICSILRNTNSCAQYYNSLALQDMTKFSYEHQNTYTIYLPTHKLL